MALEPQLSHAGVPLARDKIWNQAKSNEDIPLIQLAACDRFPQISKQTSICCTFGLDTTIIWPENPIARFGCGRFKCEGGCVRYLPGWTVQCINPECQARGHWLRADNAPEENCSNCGEHLHNVPPPLSPQLRLRPRPLTTYRPNRRAR